MNRSIFTCILLFSLICPNITIKAQSFNQIMEKAEQEARDKKRQEQSRYNAIVDSRNLDEYNRFIEDYPQGNYTSEIRRRANEIKLWNSARRNNTITSYESYLSKTRYHWYDATANSAISSIRKTQERQAWERVKSKGTLDAYRQYLQDNPNSAYRAEAEKAINRLQGAQAWSKIKNSNSISDFQEFITQYPHAEEITSAKNRLYELKGRDYYDRGDLSSAYTEFSKLSRGQLSYSNHSAYDEVMEYHEFSKLGNNSTEDSLLSFLKKYPNSKYRSRVCNMIAIAKARNFSDYASNFDYNQALSYATNSSTRSSVESYISMNKQKQKDREKRHKAWEREENGGSVNLGWEFLDIGVTIVGDYTMWYYNTGLMLRFGNYSDRIQFAIGLKPGVLGYSELISYDYHYDYYDKEAAFAFHMPVLGQLKLNLFKMSKRSRFFIFGQYQYNLVRVKDVEAEMAWGAGLGFGWKHFDWSFYYRQDIGEANNWEYSDQNYFGMSMIYYWTL